VKRHQQLLSEAIDHDGAGQRALFRGDRETAEREFTEASELYRQSWEEAPPGSYGRLVGMLKAAVLAGGGERQASYVASALSVEGEGVLSPTASYARALAALITGDDEAARRASEQMRGGSDAFDRTADAIAALAAADRERYGAALMQIVRDFERRAEHLTGVAVADTALMLQRLATRRGVPVEVSSPVLPAS
jgi:hypothetical protein